MLDVDGDTSRRGQRGRPAQSLGGPDVLKKAGFGGQCALRVERCAARGVRDDTQCAELAPGPACVRRVVERDLEIHVQV